MFRIKVAFALIVLAASIATAKVMAQDTKVVAQNTSNHSIGTHQIDRFEAIHLLQESLKSNPNDAAAWIVLGELAHEVAQDLSSQDDEPYYKLSQEAYEKALALQPKNAGLKAAVDFGREQKADAAHWDQARKKAASSYIEVRKRELAGSGFNPTVQTYSPELRRLQRPSRQPIPPRKASLPRRTNTLSTSLTMLKAPSHTPISSTLGVTFTPARCPTTMEQCLA